MSKIINTEDEAISYFIERGYSKIDAEKLAKIAMEVKGEVDFCKAVEKIKILLRKK